MSFSLVIVELDDGPWVYTFIEGEMSAGEGTPVRVQFQLSEPGERFPVFTVCDT